MSRLLQTIVVWFENAVGGVGWASGLASGSPGAPFNIFLDQNSSVIGASQSTQATRLTQTRSQLTFTTSEKGDVSGGGGGGSSG